MGSTGSLIRDDEENEYRLKNLERIKNIRSNMNDHVYASIVSDIKGSLKDLEKGFRGTKNDHNILASIIYEFEKLG